MKRTTGFTLIELIATMVVISIGFVGLARLFANTNASLSIAERTQVAAQYAQECAERVLATRRDLGFASLSITMCNALTLPAGYTRPAMTFVDAAGTSTTACPNGVTCRDVTVTVASGSISSVVRFMLVPY